MSSSSTTPSFSPSPTFPFALLKDRSNLSPWNTHLAVWAPRSSGSLSAVSSFIIIYIILRSKTKLSSIYHRIMFGLSIADIIGSISMALASLPMPSYLPREEEFGYHWAGDRLGNTRSCTAQGFFATFGIISMPSYNLMLCTYYFCAIVLQMRETKIKRRVEPFLHTFPFVTGLGLAVAPLPFDLYNPSMTAYAWCGPVPYPFECYLYPDEVECIRGDAKLMDLVYITVSIFSAIGISFIMVILLLVIRHIIQTDRMLQQLSNQLRQQGNPRDVIELRHAKEFHQNSKAAIVQAIAYMACIILSGLPTFLLSSGAVSTFGSERQQKMGDFFEKMSLLLVPLQGFFNCIIFVSHKVYNYKRVHSNVSTCHVLQLLFFTSAHDPTFVSRISIVSHDDKQLGRETNHDVLDKDKNDVDDKGKRMPFCDIEISDEAESQQHFRLSLMNGVYDDDKEDVVRSKQQETSQVELVGDTHGSPIDNSKPMTTIGSSVLDDDSAFSLPSRSTLDRNGMIVSQEDSLLRLQQKEKEPSRKYYNSTIVHSLKRNA